MSNLQIFTYKFVLRKLTLVTIIEKLRLNIATAKYAYGY